MLKILSWNIRQGGGTRVAKISAKLLQYNPEVIILSEFRNNATGIQLRIQLLKGGYRYQHVSNASSGDNSAAIFSKLPADFKLFPSSDPNFFHNIVAAEFEAFTLYGVYLPHKKKHILFDFLIEEIKKEKPVIIAGDFNSGINGEDQKGNSFWYEDRLIKMKALGCIDIFRKLNGSIREYSWYSHQGNGYRYDHTYVSEVLISISKKCYYLHEWREEGFSDHSPMILELG